MPPLARTPIFAPACSHRINVATSRAKRKLLIVGDRVGLTSCPSYWQRLSSIIAQPVPEVLKGQAPSPSSSLQRSAPCSPIINSPARLSVARRSPPGAFLFGPRSSSNLDVEIAASACSGVRSG